MRLRSLSQAMVGAKEPIQILVEDAKAAAAADVRPAILILLAASVLLFATAIANVANMQLARATARHRELTIRAALGAGTGRLARQLLIENALVGVLGGAAGLAVTIGLHAALPSLLPAGFPRVDAIDVDGRVLAFTLVTADGSGARRISTGAERREPSMRARPRNTSPSGRNSNCMMKSDPLSWNERLVPNCVASTRPFAMEDCDCPSASEP